VADRLQVVLAAERDRLLERTRSRQRHDVVRLCRRRRAPHAGADDRFAPTTGSLHYARYSWRLWRFCSIGEAQRGHRVAVHGRPQSRHGWRFTATPDVDVG
jgi:hypothetical protein